MSKTYPYYTFEEAYIKLLTKIDLKAFKDLIQECQTLANLPEGLEINKIDLCPNACYSNYEFIIFWRCLCFMYGEFDEKTNKGFVYTNNLPAIIYSLETIMEQVVD